MSELDPASTRTRSIWQRRVRDPIVAQLTQGITPEKIALTLAVGSTLALFPVIGTTTLLCLLFGIWLRLNQPIIQIVNVLCTPIHIPLVIYFVRRGQRLFHEPQLQLNMKALTGLLRDQPGVFFRQFGDVALHATVVWLIAAPFWLFGVYYISLPLLRGIARVRAENVAKSVEQRPPEHPVP